MSIPKVVKNSAVYSIVSLLQSAASFFLLPVYTAYLSPKEYGIVGVINSLSSFLSVVYLLALHGALSRFYYDYKEHEQDVKTLFGTIFVFVLLNSVIFTGLLIIFRNILLTPFVKGIRFYPSVFLGLLSVMFTPAYTLFQHSLQVRQIGHRYGINNLIKFLLGVGLTLLFVVVFELKATGVLLSAALTNFVFLGYTFVVFVPEIRLTMNKKMLVRSLRYSFPLLPHTLSGWIMTMIDRFFLNNLRTTATVGIYHIGFQFGNIINIVTTSVNQAFVPWLFESLQIEKSENIIKFAEIVLILYGFCAMCLSLFGREILSLMVSTSFRDGWKVIPFISFAYVCSGLYYFFVAPLFYNTKGTKFVSIATFIAAFTNVILNAWLIPHYGMLGASITSLFSSFFLSIMVLMLSYKIEYVAYNWGKMYVSTFGFFMLALVGFLPIQYGYLLCLKTAIFFLMTWVIYYFYQDDIEKIWLFYKSRLVRKA